MDWGLGLVWILGFYCRSIVHPAIYFYASGEFSEGDAGWPRDLPSALPSGGKFPALPRKRVPVLKGGMREPGALLLLYTGHHDCCRF